MTNGGREPDIFKGMLAGALGGLVAAYAMNQFQEVWSAAEEQINGKPAETGEDATMKTADRISEAVQGRRLTKAEKEKAVHYAFGTIMGAVCGAAVEINPATHTFAGIPFGAILFAGADATEAVRRVVRG